MKRDERVNRIGLEAPRRLLQYLNQSLGEKGKSNVRKDLLDCAPS